MESQIEHEIVALLAVARREGWYEEDPGWAEIDDRLSALGYSLAG